MQRPSSGWFLDLNEVCSDPRGPSVEVPSHPAVTTKACQLKMQGSRQEMATPSAFWPPGECQTRKGLHPVGFLDLNEVFSDPRGSLQFPRRAFTAHRTRPPVG